MATDPAVRDAYMHWLLASDEDRIVANMPKTKTAFAELKGVATRTLRRWEADEDFQLRLAAEERRRAQRRQGQVPDPAGLVGGEVEPRDARTAALKRGVEPLYEPGVDDELADDRTEYLRLKRIIVRKAADSTQHMDLYMKHWGHEFVQEELTAETSLAHLSDFELAQGVLDRVDDETFDRLVAARRARR